MLNYCQATGLRRRGYLIKPYFFLLNFTNFWTSENLYFFWILQTTSDRGDWHAVYNYGANEYIPNDGKFPTGLDAVALNFEIYDEKTGELKFGLEQIENDMVSVLDD